MNPFLFLPKGGHPLHIRRYTIFIWSRLFRELPEGTITEKHHIVPKVFGMDHKYSKQPWNIIKLSLREHYLAHLMLAHAFGGRQWVAFYLMAKLYGVKLTARQRERESIEKRYLMLGDNNPSRRLTPRKRTPEEKKVSSDIKMGSKNPMYGIPLSDYAKKLMSLRQKGKVKHTLGKYWINNGEDSTLIDGGLEVPFGWTKGRLPFSQESKKKMSISAKARGYNRGTKHRGA